jgi:hypothetical protein
LRNTYVEKRTLDFHARQEKSENISGWIRRIQALGSKFREAALKDCTQAERAGILTLSDRLRNICFTQGLQSDRIQTIVRSRNQDDFDEIAETALEEESAIFSKNERHKGAEKYNVQCTNCKRMGHTSNKCYLKIRPYSYFKTNSQVREITCWNCSKFCRKPRKTGEKQDPEVGKRARTVRRQPEDGRCYAIGCISDCDSEFLEFEIEIEIPTGYWGRG